MASNFTAKRKMQHRTLPCGLDAAYALITHEDACEVCGPVEASLSHEHSDDYDVTPGY